MKTANIIPRHIKGERNASESFPIPMQDYTLPIETLFTITGKKRSRKDLWNRATIKFVSFVNAKLTLTTTREGESHTLILTLQPDELTVACSCATPVATICSHAYQYLFGVASYGTHHSFTEFSKAGIIETALAHPSLFSIQYTGSHGIRAELKNGLGRVYELENNWVTPDRLQLFYQLPGIEKEPLNHKQSGTALCYLLMASPRETAAPFILPCAGILNKEGTGIKSFSHYLSGADSGLSQRLTPEHVPRIKACTEIMKQSEKAPGLQNLGEATGEEAEALAALFHLFRTFLPIFGGAILYSHPWYGKKHMGSRPTKTSAYPVVFGRGTVALRFQLHHSSGVYTLTLTLLIGGKAVDGYSTEAAFFVSRPRDPTLYMFSYPRDAGIAFWMEKNKNLITVFDNHFPLFSRDILEPLRRDYEVRETGKKNSGTNAY